MVRGRILGQQKSMVRGRILVPKRSRSERGRILELERSRVEGKEYWDKRKVW